MDAVIVVNDVMIMVVVVLQ